MIPEKEEKCHINGTKRTCKIYLFIYFFEKDIEDL